MIRNVLLWLRIIRPQTLFASLVPVLVAVIIAGRYHIDYSIIVASLTLLCALSLQILSNLINDCYDFLRGTDKAGRKGFKRALAESQVSLRDMKCACFATAAVACLLGLYLVYEGGVAILVTGISALLFAWLYTATRYSLSYLGIADVFVYLYYGVIATVGTSYLLLGCDISSDKALAVYRDSFFAGSVCGFISMCVLLINNIRDIDDDRKVGKRTFPVRFGKRAAEVAMLCLVVLMPLFAYLSFGFSIPLLIVVPAVVLWFKTLRAEGSGYNKCLVFAGMINAFYLLLCLLM